MSCLDLPGCHSQGESRNEALEHIREAIALWLEVEAEEAGVNSVETLEEGGIGIPYRHGRLRCCRSAETPRS
jgi:HicB_like antitoxin of bacterial toxin-antitoxin system